MLKLPGASEFDKALTSMSQGIMPEFSLEAALEVVVVAGSSSCSQVANSFATSALLMLDSRQPEPSADEQLEVLRLVAGAGAVLGDLSGRLASLAPAGGAKALVGAVLAMGEKGHSSDELKTAVQALATKPELASLPPARLL